MTVVEKLNNDFYKTIIDAQRSMNSFVVHSSSTAGTRFGLIENTNYEVERDLYLPLIFPQYSSKILKDHPIESHIISHSDRVQFFPSNVVSITNLYPLDHAYGLFVTSTTGLWGVTATADQTARFYVRASVMTPVTVITGDKDVTPPSEAVRQGTTFKHIKMQPVIFTDQADLKIKLLAPGTISSKNITQLNTVYKSVLTACYNFITEEYEKLVPFVNTTISSVEKAILSYTTISLLQQSSQQDLTDIGYLRSVISDLANYRNRVYDEIVSLWRAYKENRLDRRYYYLLTLAKVFSGFGHLTELATYVSTVNINDAINRLNESARILTSKQQIKKITTEVGATLYNQFSKSILHEQLNVSLTSITVKNPIELYKIEALSAFNNAINTDDVLEAGIEVPVRIPLISKIETKVQTYTQQINEIISFNEFFIQEKTDGIKLFPENTVVNSSTSSISATVFKLTDDVGYELNRNITSGKIRVGLIGKTNIVTENTKPIIIYRDITVKALHSIKPYSETQFDYIGDARYKKVLIAGINWAFFNINLIRHDIQIAQNNLEIAEKNINDLKSNPDMINTDDIAAIGKLLGKAESTLDDIKDFADSYHYFSKKLRKPEEVANINTKYSIQDITINNLKVKFLKLLQLVDQINSKETKDKINQINLVAILNATPPAVTVETPVISVEDLEKQIDDAGITGKDKDDLMTTISKMMATLFVPSLAAIPLGMALTFVKYMNDSYKNMNESDKGYKKAETKKVEEKQTEKDAETKYNEAQSRYDKDPTDKNEEELLNAKKEYESECDKSRKANEKLVEQNLNSIETVAKFNSIYSLIVMLYRLATQKQNQTLVSNTKPDHNSEVYFSSAPGSPVPGPAAVQGFGRLS